MNLNDRNNIACGSNRHLKRDDPPNIVSLLYARQLGMSRKLNCQFQKFAEIKVATSEMKETRCNLPANSRSTFLMAFSSDCSKVASTHGDHHIYISETHTGKHLQRLEGHPRTPWCITFHPISNDILASGCLAGEVRVWDLHGGSENWRAPNDQVIASLAFHPFQQILVIATGTCLYFWDWSQPMPQAHRSTNCDIERVRFVKFDRLGHKLITGISNARACGDFPDFIRSNFNMSYDSDPDDIPRRRLITIARPRHTSREEASVHSARPRIIPGPEASVHSSRPRIIHGQEASVHSARSRIIPGPEHQNSIVDESAAQNNPALTIIEDNSSGDETFATSNYAETQNMNNDSYLGPISPEPLDLQSELINEQVNISSVDDFNVSQGSSSDCSSSDVTQDSANTLNNESFVGISDSKLQNSHLSDDTPISGPIVSESELNHEQMSSSNVDEEGRNEPKPFVSGEISSIFDRLWLIVSDLDRRLVAPGRSYNDACSSQNEHMTSTQEVLNLQRHESQGNSSNLCEEITKLVVQIKNCLCTLTPSLKGLNQNMKQAHVRITNILQRLKNPDVINRFSLSMDWKTVKGITEELKNILEKLTEGHNRPVLDMHNSNALRTAPHTASNLLSAGSFNSLPSEQPSDLSIPRTFPDSGSSTSSSSENISRNMNGIPTRLSQSYMPRHRYHPLSTLRTFRRNLNPQFSAGGNEADSSNLRSQAGRDISSMAPITVRLFRCNVPEFSANSHEAASSNQVSRTNEDHSTRTVSATPSITLTLSNRRRLATFFPRESASSFESAPEESFEASHRYSPISDDSYDGSGRSEVLNYSPSYSALLFGASGFCDPLSQSHRIQSWDFSPSKLPDISDNTSNVVVQRCMIHNDASVDITQDGEKLVCLIPNDQNDSPNNLMFAVFSLRKEDFGTRLSIWGYISNAISVSFSPLGRYVVAGSAFSRPLFGDHTRQCSVQIIKINDGAGEHEAVNVRSFTQPYEENRMHQPSLNSVKWIPQSGVGIAFATNRGGLSICKPISGEFFGRKDDKRDSAMEE